MGKELLELSRDRRAVLSMIVFPIVLIPALMLGAALVIPRLIESGADRAKQQPIPVRIAAEEGAEAGVGESLVAGVRRALEDEGLKVEDAPEDRDLEQEVSSQKALVAVDAVTNKDKELELRVFYDAARPASTSESATILTALRELRDQRVRESLRSEGVAESLLNPFAVERENAASQERTSGAAWGAILGYVLILMMFTGGMYPIMDMTAGEKERKTLEALLASPARRGEIVLGKTLTAICSIMTTAVLMVLSLVISFTVARQLVAGMMNENEGLRRLLGTIPLDGTNIVLLAAALLPLALLGAAVMFAVALGARSFKEAQSYLTPIIFIVIVPGILGGLPGFELNPVMSLIPVLNSSQVIRAILVGDVGMLTFGITTVANLIYAGLAMFVATRMYHREQVLFRT